MHTARLLPAIALAIILAACAAPGIAVREVGSFHAGGTTISLAGLPEREIRLTPSAPPLKVNPNGDFDTGQLYVQYVKLAQPAARYPLLLWHGGGLTGVTWETKPDGAPGWQQYFLTHGHDGPAVRRIRRSRTSRA